MITDSNLKEKLPSENHMPCYSSDVRAKGLRVLNKTRDIDFVVIIYIPIIYTV